MVKIARGALLASITIDRESAKTMSTQICAAIRKMILSGALTAGERLPSSRTLAQELGVSRTTIINVFDRLTEEGLIDSKTGAGSFIGETLSTHLPKLPTPSAEMIGKRRDNLRLARCLEQAIGQFSKRIPHESKAFTTGIPAFDVFPLAQWSRLVSKHYRSKRDIVMGYGDPEGFLPLRKAIANHLRGNRGLSCEPEQIFIVSGAQQAFNLICSVLLNPGDKVWFENPGAIGARNSLSACGMDLYPIPIDREGIIVEEGLRRAPYFRLAFVTPSHQQPIGVTLSLARRIELLQAAEQSDAWILEDDYDGEFRYQSSPLPTLQSLDTTERVIYVGTFSKSLFPALRLGYFVAPPILVDTFQKVSGAFLQGAPSNLQAVVADFIDEGHFATHIRRMCKIYAARHNILIEASRQRLQGLLEVIPTDTGFHTIGRLAQGYSEQQVSAAAAAKGISVSPIGRYCIEPVSMKGLVLGFSTIKAPEIKAGVEALAQVLEELKP
ncbi:GntR family transcriptional regulator [Paralcaligenes ureilyticus]|uniref:GntR family transcriptional regulator n=2 Tax=Paralcaligenes ureilyticus TaxID=627131 RepID=A0A4R3M187_9BURK|nr:GntR family transcriptional regulator [Paralcaligenes ureilyticus]